MKRYKQLIDKYKAFGIDLNSKHISIYRYEGDDGSFDYDLYKKAQTNVNLKKIDFSGPDSKRLKKISNHIEQNIPDLTFGLCHGTRRGSEQRDFKRFLGIDVLGTEISHTASDFDRTIQWDFHEMKDEWKNNVCFIYSNSLDHSYDPIKCLGVWMSCIKPKGKIYLQRGADDTIVGSQKLHQKFGPTSKGIDDIQLIPADIFQANEEVFLKIVDAAGNGEWQISKPEELILNWKHKTYDHDVHGIKRVLVLERK